MADEEVWPENGGRAGVRGISLSSGGMELQTFFHRKGAKYAKKEIRYLITAEALRLI
jgi:hypothetical protein